MRFALIFFCLLTADGGSPAPTWKRCQIIRVQPDSRLLIEVDHVQQNFSLRSINLGPPSVAFVQRIAQVAKQETRCDLTQGELETRASKKEPWVSLTSPAK
ncbi:MAG: hypothetical protein ACT4TC_05225 [Myxococcaceae bacterium]